MELNESAEIDTSQVEDRRGSGGGLSGVPIPIGRGGLIGTLVTVVLLVIGGGLVGTNMLDGSGDNTNLEQQCAADNPDRLRNTECRNVLFINSINDYWADALPQTFGQPYQSASTVFFAQAVNTGCGAADAGVGPFYCPPDHKAYIDLTFWNELDRRFGAEGEFAQAYVLAHEYGHHVQALLGTDAQVRRAQQRDPDNANEYSVMLELQADCYAGVWAKNATRTTDAGGQPIFRSITQADINQALDAAAAVGDDAIQRQGGGPVDESTFTHGTSAQRQQWFGRGFQTGDGKACDTFGNAV
jgi:predicted metalloprotease